MFMLGCYNIWREIANSNGKCCYAFEDLTSQHFREEFENFDGEISLSNSS